MSEVAACARLRSFISNIAATARYFGTRDVYERVGPRVAVMWQLSQGVAEGEACVTCFALVSGVWSCIAAVKGSDREKDGYPGNMTRSRTSQCGFDGLYPEVILEARGFYTV